MNSERHNKLTETLRVVGDGLVAHAGSRQRGSMSRMRLRDAATAVFEARDALLAEDTAPTVDGLRPAGDFMAGILAGLKIITEES